MASLPSLPALPISYLSLLFILRILPTTISQGPISSSPGIAQCTASLLPLASCAPFVQGIASVPAMACCDNLKQLYTNVPYCLCLLLNGTTLSSFPLNTTRALQLPDLCSLQVNISTCSGTSMLNFFHSLLLNFNICVLKNIDIRHSTLIVIILWMVF